MTTIDRKDQIATWNGDASSWLEYVKRVRLQYERTEPRKRKLLGAELASRLSGRAWDVTSAEVDHERLQKPDGAAYLLTFLEERLCKTVVSSGVLFGMVQLAAFSKSPNAIVESGISIQKFF